MYDKTIITTNTHIDANFSRRSCISRKSKRALWLKTVSQKPSCAWHSNNCLTQQNQREKDLRGCLWVRPLPVFLWVLEAQRNQVGLSHPFPPHRLYPPKTPAWEMTINERARKGWGWARYEGLMEVMLLTTVPVSPTDPGFPASPSSPW